MKRKVIGYIVIPILLCAAATIIILLDIYSQKPYTIQDIASLYISAIIIGLVFAVYLFHRWNFIHLKTTSGVFFQLETKRISALIKKSAGLLKTLLFAGIVYWGLSVGTFGILFIKFISRTPIYGGIHDIIIVYAGALISGSAFGISMYLVCVVYKIVLVKKSVQLPAKQP